METTQCLEMNALKFFCPCHVPTCVNLARISSIQHATRLLCARSAAVAWTAGKSIIPLLRRNAYQLFCPLKLRFPQLTLVSTAQTSPNMRTTTPQQKTTATAPATPTAKSAGETCLKITNSAPLLKKRLLNEINQSTHRCFQHIFSETR